MIEESKHIKELYYVNHRNDKTKHTGFDYSNKLFDRTMSGLMFDNPTLKSFLSRLQSQAVWMIESTLVVRNFWNYTCTKYYNQHPN